MANNNKHTGPNVPALRFPEFSGEWETFQLSDLAAYSKERVKMEILSSNNYVSTENMQQDFAGIKDAISLPSSGTAVEFQVGDILISNIRPYLKKIWLSDRNGGCSTDVLALRTKNEKVDSSFLYCCLANDDFVSYVMSGAKGVKMPRGDKQHILSYNLGVPSVQEQRRIAELVSLLEKRISAQSKIIEEQETLLKSLADKLFLQNNHSCQLSELVNIEKGKQLNADTLSETGDYYVMNGGISPSGYYSEYNVPAGAISISEGGNSCGYVQFNEKPFWSGGHCYSLQCRTNLVDYKYIYYYLKTKEADVMALRIGSGLPNIQKKDIEKFTITYPSLQLQKQFVKALDALSGKINTEKNLLEKYCQQKSYLLSQMFI